PVQIENARPLHPRWRLTRPSRPSQRDIDAYGSAASLRAGDTLALHVSTAQPTIFQYEVFRMGWYGGAGARQGLSSAAPVAAMPPPMPWADRVTPVVSWLQAGRTRLDSDQDMLEGVTLEFIAGQIE